MYFRFLCVQDPLWDPLVVFSYSEERHRWDQESSVAYGLVGGLWDGQKKVHVCMLLKQLDCPAFSYRNYIILIPDEKPSTDNGIKWQKFAILLTTGLIWINSD